MNASNTMSSLKPVGENIWVIDEGIPKLLGGKDSNGNVGLPAGSTIDCPILSDKVAVSAVVAYRRLDDGTAGDPLVDACTFEASNGDQVVFSINFEAGDV